MKHLNVLKTFFSRFLVLVLNFGLVIYTANKWGSEGKGVVSIVIADLALIGFLANIFVGSSMSYFASKYKTEEIIPYAYLWSLLIGLCLPFMISFYHVLDYSFYLILLSVFTSLLSANINLFIGLKNIKMFNFYTVLQQLLHVVFVLMMVYVIKNDTLDAYFIAQILSTALLFLASSVVVFKNCRLSWLSLSLETGKKLFDYGWKTQLSAFLQFLNYRLSFYFLEFFKGIASVGIFSVGIAFSEAVWMVSRSLSIVLYSDLVNNENEDEAIVKTKIALRISFLVTLAALFVMLIVPTDVYSLIFGKDFSQTKEIIILLSPGILSIAVSNIIGYYFAAINKLRILNVKAVVGLFFTVVGSYYIIPVWGIRGACVVTTIAYCVSSALLFRKFYQLTEFRISDFLPSKKEVKFLLGKISFK